MFTTKQKIILTILLMFLLGTSIWTNYELYKMRQDINEITVDVIGMSEEVNDMAEDMQEIINEINKSIDECNKILTEINNDVSKWEVE